MAVERKHQQFYVDPIGDQRRREIVERYQRPPEFIRNQRRATFAWLVFVFGHITSLAVCIFTSPLWFAVSLLCTVVMARLARGRSLTRSQRPPDVKETRARALNLRINDPVADIVREVERTEKEIAELPHRLVENLNARTAQEREQQLADHLDRHTIEDAIHSGRLKGIGPSRLATLVSFGIETAADVDETHLENVHGFGEKLIELLVQWREELERIFTYRPDGRIRRQVEQDMEQKRAKLLTTIDRLRVDISARAQSHQGRVVDAEERALAAELQAQTFAIAEAGNIERFGLAVFVFVVVSVISNWDGLAAVLATQPDVDTRPQEPQSTHVFVSAHDVALRTESGEKLGRLTLNTGCVLLDEHMSARGYRHVRCNDDEGYVHADLLAAQPLTLASALADANTARQRGDLKRALGRVQTAHALAPSSQEAIDLCHTLFWEIEFAALRDTRSRVTHAPVTLPTRCPTTSARCLLAAFQTRWPGTWQALHLDGADFCVATYADSVLTVRCGTRQHASATIEMVTQSPLGRLPPFSDGAITEQPKGVSNDQQ